MMGAAACRDVGLDPGDHCLSTEHTQWDTLPGFSHITGGQGAGGGGWGERWAPRSTAICWAVAGKGFGPLFSSSPPVVTNQQRARDTVTEAERDGQKKEEVLSYWGQLKCGERGRVVRWYQIQTKLNRLTGNSYTSPDLGSKFIVEIATELD